MRFRFSSSTKKEATVSTEDQSSSGGLLPVMTGISPAKLEVKSTSPAPPLVSTKASTEATQQPNQESHQKQQGQKISSEYDDILMDAFDNDDEELTDPNNQSPIQTAQSQPVRPQHQQSTPAPSPVKADDPKSSSSTLDSTENRLASQKAALENLNQVHLRLQDQMATWQEQAIASGRKALQAKKVDAETGKVILTNECKLQLLRRKLLKTSLANAEIQLMRLEESQEALAQEIERQETKERESNAMILSLEKELEHVDVIKDILSRNLGKDLIPDDDTVSVMEYDEAELLHELNTLATGDDDGTISNTTVGQSRESPSTSPGDEATGSRKDRGVPSSSAPKNELKPKKSNAKKSTASTLSKPTLF